MRKFNINVEGKNYVVEVEEVGGVANISAPIAQSAPAAAAPVAAAPKVVGAGVPFNSPMPGLIKAIKAKSGTAVKKGDVVLVLEAMKMENDIAAQSDGVVTVTVSEGATVNSGDVLFTIA